MIINIKMFRCDKCGFSKVITEGESEPVSCPACNIPGVPEYFNDKKWQDEDPCKNCAVRLSPTFNGVCWCALPTMRRGFKC